MEIVGEEGRHQVAFLLAPGMGHIIPVLEFAKRLHRLHRISSTFIFPDFGFPMTSNKSFLAAALTSSPAIDVIYLPPPPPHSTTSHEAIASRISQAVARCLPALRQRLKVLAESTHLVALFTSIVGTDAFDLADELGIKRYVFNHLSAMTTSLFMSLPDLDRSFAGPYRDLKEPVKIPGCVSVDGREMPDWMDDRDSPIYKSFVHNSKRYRLADGIVVSTFSDLEPAAIAAVESLVPVYPVGPLLRTGVVDDSGGSDCLAWLDKQPRHSVLYICFGSAGALSRDQLKEMAVGLEKSGQRFIWAVRSPQDKSASATFYGGGEDPLDFLPEGFVGRTEESGLGFLLRSWAPQVKILGHESTGGFLSHAGWNSIVESVVHGMPLIAWPLFAEQKMHAGMVSESAGLNVAIRAERDGGDGLVSAENVCKCVKELMAGEEGRRIREKMRVLKDAAAMAVSSQGSSTKALAHLVASFLNK